MASQHHDETFVVDKAGLAKLLERRGKEFVLGELFQNAVDENVTRVDMTLELLDGELAELRVQDDNPEGFKDLSHAYTLFAESDKKDDPEKRGRFNLGEKLVIALCREARVSTTKGTITFNAAGRSHSDERRKVGSVFEGVFPMSADEYQAAVRFVNTLIVPEGVTATFNGLRLPDREPVATFDARLRTERADADGILRPTTRKTAVRVFDPLPGEKGMLYELGIPVVETGDRWHVDVGQKVPLNTDRDNVPPAFLRDVRTHTLNATAYLVTGEAARGGWVNDALEDEAVDPDAVRTIVRERYGEKAVIADPTDREGTHIAASKGYTVVPGGAFSRDAWKNVRESDALKPAGLVTPSPNPQAGEEERQTLDPEHWPEAVKLVVGFARELAVRVLDVDKIDVTIANDPQWPFLATYGPRLSGRQGILTLNLGRLGFRWFEQGVTPSTLELLIHEFGHHYSDNHLDRSFYDACCRVGARVAQVAYIDPGFFTDHGLTDTAVEMKGAID